MPLEIRELIIKATVSNDGASPNQNGGQEASGNISIDEIVEKVIEIINKKNER